MNTALLALILAYNGLASFPGADHCAPTACTEYEVVKANGYLVCQDTDEVYPPGHWRYDMFEDNNECLNLAEVEY